MTEDAARLLIVQVLGEIAPECAPSHLLSTVNLRDELDLDSMDFQRFVVRLHEELRIDIPERDYPKLLTLDGAIKYLASETRIGHGS